MILVLPSVIGLSCIVTILIKFSANIINNSNMYQFIVVWPCDLPVWLTCFEILTCLDPK